MKEACPPSFLKKNVAQKKVLLTIEVQITPTRMGKVVIKQGDDVETVARNFCKAYSLGQQMELTLINQLNSHIKDYYKK